MTEHRELLERELANAGIKPEIERNGHGHMRIRWTYNNQIRSVLTSWNPGDHRSTLNARARIRGFLREDGLLDRPKEEPKKGLAKALEVPVVREPDNVRIERLEADVNALLDIIAELTSKLVKVGVKLDDGPKEAPPPAPPKQRKNAWRHDFLLCMEYQPESISTIAKRAGCETSTTSVRLNILKNEGIVENPQRGMWRKKVRTNGVNGHQHEQRA